MSKRKYNLKSILLEMPADAAFNARPSRSRRRTIPIGQRGTTVNKDALSDLRGDEDPYQRTGARVDPDDDDNLERKLAAGDKIKKNVFGKELTDVGGDDMKGAVQMMGGTPGMYAVNRFVTLTSGQRPGRVGQTSGVPDVVVDDVELEVKAGSGTLDIKSYVCLDHPGNPVHHAGANTDLGGLRSLADFAAMEDYIAGRNAYRSLKPTGVSTARADWVAMVRTKFMNSTGNAIHTLTIPGAETVSGESYVYEIPENTTKTSILRAAAIVKIRREMGILITSLARGSASSDCATCGIVVTSDNFHNKSKSDITGTMFKYLKQEYVDKITEKTATEIFTSLCNSKIDFRSSEVRITCPTGWSGIKRLNTAAKCNIPMNTGNFLKADTPARVKSMVLYGKTGDARISMEPFTSEYMLEKFGFRDRSAYQVRADGSEPTSQAYLNRVYNYMHPKRGRFRTLDTFHSDSNNRKYKKLIVKRAFRSAFQGLPSDGTFLYVKSDYQFPTNSSGDELEVTLGRGSTEFKFKGSDFFEISRELQVDPLYTNQQHFQDYVMFSRCSDGSVGFKFCGNTIVNYSVFPDFSINKNFPLFIEMCLEKDNLYDPTWDNSWVTDAMRQNPESVANLQAYVEQFGGTGSPNVPRSTTSVTQNLANNTALDRNAAERIDNSFDQEEETRQAQVINDEMPDPDMLDASNYQKAAQEYFDFLLSNYGRVTKSKIRQILSDNIEGFSLPQNATVSDLMTYIDNIEDASIKAKIYEAMAEHLGKKLPIFVVDASLADRLEDFRKAAASFYGTTWGSTGAGQAQITAITQLLRSHRLQFSVPRVGLGFAKGEGNAREWDDADFMPGRKTADGEQDLFKKLEEARMSRKYSLKRRLFESPDIEPEPTPDEELRLPQKPSGVYTNDNNEAQFDNSGQDSQMFSTTSAIDAGALEDVLKAVADDGGDPKLDPDFLKKLSQEGLITLEESRMLRNYFKHLW